MNKPFLVPLVDFVEENWIEFTNKYIVLDIEREADAVLEWLKEQEGLS